MRGRERQILAWVMALCMVVCLASSLRATDIFALSTAEDEILTDVDSTENLADTDMEEDDQDTDEGGDDQNETDESDDSEIVEDDSEDGSGDTSDDEPAAAADEEVQGGITGKSKIVAGATTTLTGTATTVSGKKGSWQSSNTSVATVSGTGDSTVVKGVKAGTATITHTYYVTTYSFGWFGQLQAKTTTKKESFDITILSFINHYKLAETSSNIDLWAIDGYNKDFVSLSPGGIYETTSQDVYFYIRVKNGYAASTKFRHVFALGDPTRETFPTEYSNQYTEYSKYGPDGRNHPGYDAAGALGCQYMCWYTKQTKNAWAQFEITANPVGMTVEYNAGEAENAEDIPVDDTTYYHINVTDDGYGNHSITIPEVEPYCDGESFQYWLGSDGRTYKSGETITVDDGVWNALVNNTFTFTAYWKADMYRLSYDGNKSTSGGPVIDTNEYVKGEEAIVSDCTYKKYNYDFIVWNTEPDGSGDLYQPGDKIEIKENTTLYAMWGVEGDVTIRYIAANTGGYVTDKNGNKVDSYTEVFNPSEGEEPSGSTAIADTGYNFVGWEDVTDTSSLVSSENAFVPTEPADGWPKTITYRARFEEQPKVVIKSNSLSVVYDGEKHSVSGYTVNDAVSDTFVIDGVTYTIEGLSASAERTDAGCTDVSFDTKKLVIKNSSGKDVTGLLNIKYEVGKLIVEKRPVLLTSGSDSKEYDGKALTCDTVTASYRSDNEADEEKQAFVDGEGFTATVTGSRKKVGFAVNKFTYELTWPAKSENYDITTSFGLLTVVNRNAKYVITLVPNSLEAEYDEKEHSVSGFEETEFTIDGESYTVSGVSASVKGTKIGSYPVVVAGVPVVEDSEGYDVSDQFAVYCDEGYLTITGKYTLTINYVDTDGNKLADSYVGKYDGGAAVGEITSPEVSGYKPEYSSVTTKDGVMPEMNVIVDVVYEKVADAGSGGGVIVPDDGKDKDDNDDDKVVDKDKDDDGDKVIDKDKDDDSDDSDSSTGAGDGDDNDSNNNTTVPGNGAGGNNNGGNTGNTTPGNNNGGNDGNTSLTAIDDGEVPMGVIEVDEDGNAEIVPATIDDEEVPEAAGEENLEKWALINLLAAIFTVLIALCLLITWFAGRKKREEDEKYAEYDDFDAEEREARLKRRGLSRIAGVIAAAASVITFILTENMSNPMTMTDDFTILMIVILVIEIIFALLAKKSGKDDEKDDDGEAVYE